MKRGSWQFLAIGIMGLALLTALPGCAGKMRLGKRSAEAEKELVIPDLPTAKEQFAFAKMYQSQQLTPPELDRRRILMEKIAQYYNRVLINFPKDPVYVPLTYLELGDCAAQSDYMDKAIEMYRLAQQVSQDEFVQVRADYSIARIYDSMEKYAEAKVIYKRLMDEHKQTQNGRVRDVLKRAYQRYMLVHEEGAPPGKI